MPTNIVVDSSVIVKWLNQENETNLKQADKVLSDAQNGEIVLFAPELSRYEIGNALLKKNLDLPQAQDTLGTAYRLSVNFVQETKKLAFATYRMAQSAQITYYDASFVALAKQTKATLVTDNPKHQAKVKNVKVIALEDYK